jgi:hypothetical protein
MEGQQDTYLVDPLKREFIVAQVMSVFRFKRGFSQVPDEFQDEASQGDKKFCLVQLLQPVQGKSRGGKEPRQKAFGEKVFRPSVFLDTKEPEVRVMSISNIVIFFDALTQSSTIPAKALKDARDRASVELINHATDARVNSLSRGRSVVATTTSSQNSIVGVNKAPPKKRQASSSFSLNSSGGKKTAPQRKKTRQTSISNSSFEGDERFSADKSSSDEGTSEDIPLAQYCFRRRKAIIAPSSDSSFDENESSSSDVPLREYCARGGTKSR